MLALLKETALNWWAYRRTRRALEQLDPRLLADLSIEGERLEQIAWTAARSGGSLSIYDLKADQYECAGGTPARHAASQCLQGRDCGAADIPSKTQLQRAA